ncbi:MAG: A/G-specific adenine glycosylase [Verrucomicrobiales bacterium]|nr:A/G-specific adenine glycosylase [Verrucomicrobiales bacterium]
MALALDQAVVLALLDWYGQSARDLPWRRTSDPYAIWVSEIMLQQTQVRTVIAYWERWMARFPTIKSLADAPESAVLKLWEGLGYYRRARNLHAAARLMLAERGGRFPTDHAAVLELPGIGRYTAGAICSIAYDQPTPIVDGNVARVLTRLGGLRGDPSRGPLSRRLWDWAERVVKTAAETGRPRACSHLNQALMELGALVCTPRSPKCESCPLAALCRAHALGREEAFPEAGERQKITARWFEVLVFERRGKFAVRQRPATEVNGGLWEFPNFEVPDLTGAPAEVATRAIAEMGLRRGGRVGTSQEEPRLITTVRHSITRYRITQRAHWLAWPGPAAVGGKGLEWRARGELEALPFTTAHRRILKALSAEFPVGSGRDEEKLHGN